MNVALWLERAGRSHPTRPAIAVGTGAALEYGALARRSAGMATALRTHHRLEPGDRVAIVAKNHPQYVEALFAIWWAGLVAVPVNAKLHATEVAWILEHCGARLAYTSADCEASTSGVPTLTFGTEAYERDAADEPADVTPRGPDDLAWLFYTSGTTGRPKGAMLTHRNLMAMSLSFLTGVDPTQPTDALLHAAPMSHGSGLYALPVVCRAAVNVVPESGGFDADEVLACAAARPGTSMFAAPTMVRRLVEAPGEPAGAGFRSLIWGGAPMMVSDVLRALDRFGPCLTQIYGLGETPMTISVLAKDVVATRDLERLGSAGTVSPVVDVRIADDGEILVRGDTVMRGYWDDPDATARALAEGWLHTGDVGELTPDGYLHLRDRAKDLIISGGSNIYPREVEEVLTEHQAVTEVAVIGRPDPEWGEIVVAYVVGDASPEALDRFCLERIARFKRPKVYVKVDALPKSNYGKILKKELRDLDAQAPLATKVGA
jgi:long-chain acyl-CoA synthetase